MRTSTERRLRLQVGLMVAIPLIFAFIIISLLIFGAIGTTNERWDILTSNFVYQANSLGERLPPGGTGTISIPSCYADELILLPRYFSRKEIAWLLPNHSQGLIDDLISYSDNKTITPALVWLKKDRIRSINHCEFVVGVNLTVISWRLKGVHDIKVIKETSSPNGFLSISFVEDQQKR